MGCGFARDESEDEKKLEIAMMVIPQESVNHDGFRNGWSCIATRSSRGFFYWKGGEGVVEEGGLRGGLAVNQVWSGLRDRVIQSTRG